MRSIVCEHPSVQPAPFSMVWIPGAYNTAQDFIEAGFPQSVQERGIALNLTFVDLELAHLGDRTSLQRLRSEIVLPSRAQGVSTWLAGISLGGLIALDYAACFPGELDGLCLLAPYLGNRMLTAEIAQAPGLTSWQPGALAETDEERRIWRYIKDRHGESERLYLGFGRQDRFKSAHELLAAVLPTDSVDIVEGGHDWRTWTQLWENFLDARFL